MWLSPLPERAARINLTCPVERNNPGIDITVKRRTWPIANPFDQTVLHRVDVAIFDVAGIVSFIANQMLPEAPLPDAAFVAFDPNGTQLFPLR
jgi:hypothetical protein